MSWSSYAIKENGRWKGIAEINELPIVVGTYKSRQSAEKYANQYLRQQIGEEESRKEVEHENDRRVQIYGESTTEQPSAGAPSLQRGSTPRSLRCRQRDIRHLKTRQKLSIRKAH